MKIYAPKEGFGVYGFDLPSTFYRKDDTLPPEQRYYDGTPPKSCASALRGRGRTSSSSTRRREIAPGIHLIALVSDKPGTLELRELSLAINTPDGMVVVVGCSHPGIDKIVKAAARDQSAHPLRRRRLSPRRGQRSGDRQASSTVLHDTYKVAYVAPGHCTGEPTFAALKKAFGDRYLYAGLGTTIELNATRGHSVQVMRTLR